MKKTFDLLNFFYGFGAAVVLIAALFKFLGWQYANEFFVIGLTTEALTFLISGISWKTKKKQYEWEKLFPQLEEDAPSAASSEEALAQKGEQLQVRSIVSSVNQLNVSVRQLQEVTKTLTETVKRADENYKKFGEGTDAYQEELNKLRGRLAAANDSLKSFEKFKGN